MKITLTRTKIKGGFGGIALRLANDMKVVSVGIQKGAGSYPDGGPAIADVANWNSSGTDKIPARPFITSAMLKHQKDYARMLKIITRLTMQGSVGVERARRNLGIRGVTDVRDTIEAFSSPRNSPITIANKGFDNPLIHTRLLKKTINWKEEDYVF
jgi:hypothetical protein